MALNRSLAPASLCARLLQLWPRQPAGAVALIVGVLATAACGLGVTRDLIAGTYTGVDAPAPTDGTGGAGGAGGQIDLRKAITLAGTLGPRAVASSQAQLSVACTTLSAQPHTGTAPLNAQGNFVVTVENAVDAPLSCALLGQGNARLANFTFYSEASDIVGDQAVSHDVALTGNVDLGKVDWDDTTFEVVVHAVGLAGHRSANEPNDAFAPSSTFVVAQAPAKLVQQSEAPCAAGAAACAAGLRLGDRLLLARYPGTRLDDNSAVVGYQLWDNSQQAYTCGDRVGLSRDEQRQAQLRFTDADPTNFAFIYSATLSWPNAADNNAQANSIVSDGYRLEGVAQAVAAYPRCSPTTVQLPQQGNVDGIRCGPDRNGLFQIGSADGCTDAQTGLSTGYVPTAADWTRAQTAGQCDTKPAGGGLTAIDCLLTPMGGGRAVHCYANSGDFRADGTPAGPGQSFDAADFAAAPPRLAPRERCGNADTSDAAGVLLQRRCYADYMAASGAQDANNACLARYAVNPTSLDANAQIVRNFRPKHLPLADLLQPWPQGGGVATKLGSVGTAYASHPTLGSVPVACWVVTTTSLAMVPYGDDDGVLLVSRTQQQGTDDTRPACLAAFATGAHRSVALLRSDK